MTSPTALSTTFSFGLFPHTPPPQTTPISSLTKPLKIINKSQKSYHFSTCNNLISKILTCATQSNKSPLERAKSVNAMIQKCPLSIQNQIYDRLSERLPAEKAALIRGSLPYNPAVLLEVLLEVIPLDLKLTSPPLTRLSKPSVTQVLSHNSSNEIFQAMKIACNPSLRNTEKAVAIELLLKKYPHEASQIYTQIRERASQPKTIDGEKWAKEHAADNVAVLYEALLEYLPLTSLSDTPFTKKKLAEDSTPKGQGIPEMPPNPPSIPSIADPNSNSINSNTHNDIFPASKSTSSLDKNGISNPQGALNGWINGKTLILTGVVAVIALSHYFWSRK